MQPRHPVRSPSPRQPTAIPARFITSRARVLAILARWDASIAARALPHGAAR